MVTPGGQIPKCWPDFDQNMGVMTITHQFGYFNDAKQSQNTFSGNYEHIYSKTMLSPGVRLYMVTPGVKYSNYGQNMAVLRITHQYGPFNHRKQSQNHIWCKV